MTLELEICSWCISETQLNVLVWKDGGDLVMILFLLKGLLLSYYFLAFLIFILCSETKLSPSQYLNLRKQADWHWSFTYPNQPASSTVVLCFTVALQTPPRVQQDCLCLLHLFLTFNVGYFKIWKRILLDRDKNKG